MAGQLQFGPSRWGRTTLLFYGVLWAFFALLVCAPMFDSDARTLPIVLVVAGSSTALWTGAIFTFLTRAKACKRNVVIHGHGIGDSLHGFVAWSELRHLFRRHDPPRPGLPADHFLVLTAITRAGHTLRWDRKLERTGELVNEITTGHRQAIRDAMQAGTPIPDDICAPFILTSDELSFGKKKQSWISLAGQHIIEGKVVLTFRDGSRWKRRIDKVANVHLLSDVLDWRGKAAGAYR